MPRGDRRCNWQRLHGFGGGRYYRQKDIVKLVLDKGANPNINDKKTGFSALHYAVQNHFFDIGKMLLENGANVNAQGNHGKTSLILALFNRSQGCKIIDLLLAPGIDKTIKNKYGISAEDTARRFKFEI